MSLATLFLWALVSLTFWSDAATTVGVESLPLLALLLFMLWDLFRTEKQIDSALQAFVIGSGAAALSLLSNYRADTDLSYLRWGMTGTDLGTAQRFAADGLDPNELAVTMSAAVLFAGYLLLKARSSARLRILNLLFIPVGILSVALTGSRAGAVSIMPVLLYLALQVRRSNRNGSLILAVAVVLFIWGGQTLVPDLTVQRLLSAGSSAASGDFGTRQVAWAEGFEMFVENPLQGVGAYAFRANAPSGLSPHSLPIQVLAELGIIGLILLSGGLASAFRAAHRLHRLGESVWLALVASWVPGALTLGWTYRKFSWFALSMVVAAAESHLGETPRSFRRNGRRKAYALSKYVD